MAVAQPAPGWEPAWCPTERRWFYTDRIKGLSAWRRPENCSVELPSQPPDGASSVAIGDLPVGWECAFDPKTKKRYYYNRSTGERKWALPPASHAAPAVDRGRAGAPTNGVATTSGRDEASSFPAASPAFPPTMTAPAGVANGGPARTVATSSISSPSAGAVAAAGQRARAAGAGSTVWNAEDFLRRLTNARQSGEPRAVKAVLKEVSESNYKLRGKWVVPRTVHVPFVRLKDERPLGNGGPEVTFSYMTTADAILRFALESRNQVEHDRVICALNFANGVDVGGGYKNGATAQEEDLCRRMPNLYTSLFNAQREGLYPFGPSTCRDPSAPQKYSDVLWTPDVVMARANETDGYALLAPEDQVQACLVSAAAPNLRFARVEELCDLNLMYDTVQSIFLAPKALKPEVTTLILGAWGCGAFGGDPEVVGKLFCRALVDDRLGHMYKEIHFAIPNAGVQDRNGSVFREILNRNGVVFTEI